MATGPRPKEEYVAEPLLLPAWVNPDLDRLMVVHKEMEDSYFRSWAESKVDLPAGAVFARINGITPTSKQDYATVQSGLNLHFIWNSDLYYCNHSCAPSLECDTSTWEMRVSRDRPLKKGDILSVFYPSTEWTMDREFECWCGAGEGKCCGIIKGARDMDDRDLQRFWLNDHIHDMRKQEANRRID
ncbi:uncharacterized protein BDW43DRAFT_316033 [Aspergillus alliaceus]|uniref:uncharacterized protein n=1 Tax=Petromyces alliaceus TaxID=209559 RepID=UPI0012A63203|nr:uncharacterized protein BDW43DRAFT_316033 [Aspergillus alliaceus]KAB8228285.1 hypothetical protein BDW43DRAFT_316033 [Aspergillus alliaceus]